SNLPQAQRSRAREGFRRGDFQVLVATNSAARGLDVDHITHVVSFDVPTVPDDYIHRIGRTARAQAEGDAFLLVSPAEEPSLGRIERQIGQRLPRITLPDFDYSQATPARADRPGKGPCKPGAHASPPGGAADAGDGGGAGSRGAGRGGGPGRPDASGRVPPAKAPMTSARSRGWPPATRRAKANEPRQSGVTARGF